MGGNTNYFVPEAISANKGNIIGGGEVKVDTNIVASYIIELPQLISDLEKVIQRMENEGNLQENGRRIGYTTHSIDEISRIFEKILQAGKEKVEVRMKNGNLLQIDKEYVRQLYKDYFFSEFSNARRLVEEHPSLYAISALKKYKKLLAEIGEQTEVSKEYIREKEIQILKDYLDGMLNALNSTQNKEGNLQYARGYKQSLLELGVPESEIRTIPTN